MALLNLPLPNAAGEQQPPRAVLLVPVTDYNAFLGNFQPQTHGDVSTIQLTGKQMFVKQAGGYAVLSELQDAVANYAPAAGNDFEKNAGHFGSKVLGGSDIMVYVDLGTVGPVLQPFVAMGMMQAQQQLADPALGPDMKMAQAMMGLYGDAINAVLRDSKSAVIGLDLSAQGIGLSGSVQFKPDTPTAQMFAKSGQDKLDFNRLPNRPYLFATSMDLSGLPLQQMLDAIAGRFPADSGFSGIMKNAVEMMKNAGDQAQQAYYSPDLAAGPGSFLNAVTVYTSDNPAAFIKQYKQSILAMNNLEIAPNSKYTTSYTDNVMQIDGRNVDQFSLKMQLPPEAMQQLGPAAMLFAGDMGGYVVPTQQAVVMSQGADPMLIKQAIGVADGKGENALNTDAGITAMRKQLYDHRVAETYIGVGSIMNLANTFIAMFAPDAALQVPPNLPPVASSVSVHETGIGSRNFVPLTTIVAVKNAVMKVMQAQQQPASVSDAGAAPAAEPAPMPAIAPAPVAEPEPAPVTRAPAAPVPEAAPVAEPVAAITVDQRGESPRVIAMTDNTFNHLAVKADKPVLVDFRAAWSGPCKTQAAIVSNIADKLNDQVVVGKIDVDHCPRTVDTYGIRMIPTVIVLKNGVVSQRFEGLTSQEKLEAALASTH
jgi:thioredoxin 1